MEISLEQHKLVTEGLIIMVNSKSLKKRKRRRKVLKPKNIVDY